MRGAFTALGLAMTLIAAERAAHALDPTKRITQYMHRSWGNKAGLPQNTVLSMVQTADGYLWMATQEGLGRFDGVTFTPFDERNTPCLSNPWITRMTLMPDGAVWLIPFHGSPVLMKDGAFRCDAMPAAMSSETITAIEPGTHGGIWFASNQDGLFLVRDGRVARTYRGAPDDLLTSILIRDLTLARDGSLWVATDGGGLNRIDRNGAIEVFDASRGLSSNKVSEVIEARDGTIWVATTRGVDTIAHGRITHVHALPSVRVRAILEDSRGTMWFGTDTGLYRLHDRKVSSYGQPDGLAGPIVSSLLEDREGNLWVGTFIGVDVGVDRFSDVLFTPYAEPEGLANGQVWSVFEEEPGILWIGTERGGLSRLDLTTGQVRNFGPADGLADESVRSLYRARNGSILVGTYRSGTFRAAPWRHDTTWFEPIISADPRCDANVVAIAEDVGGVLWIATKGLLDDRVGVLCRMESGRFRVVERGGGWKEDFFSCLFQSRDARLFLCSASGLHAFRGHELTTYTRRDGLSSDFLLTAYEDEEGALWIGTGGGGLNRLKDGVIRHVTSSHGLFDDTVFGIVDDLRGNLWLSSNRGVFRVNKRQLDDFFAGRRSSIDSVVYGVEHGMRSSECNGGSQYPSWRSADGRLWFATTMGAVVVDPRREATNRVPPNVLIERISADGHDRAIEPGLTLEPGTRALEFTYTATSLTSSEQIKFRYKLEGFDSDWVEASGRRTAYYTNLSPGSYRFRVIAANSDGWWNPQGASVAFELAPAYHQTWWFSLSCLVAVFSIVLAAHQVRVRHMRTREKELQLHVAERTRQIAEAESYSRAIVGNVGEGIVTFDEGGRISRWNAAAERIFAYTAAEAIGSTAAMIDLPGPDDVHGAHGSAVVEQARRKDGAVIPVEIHATSTSIGGDTMTIWLVRDLTDARRAEAKVAAMQRELLATSRKAGMAQVATSVLHNVGNALTSVNLSAEFVLDTVRHSKLEGLGKAVAMLQLTPPELAAFLTETEKGRQLPVYLARISDVLQSERSRVMGELDSMEKGIEHIKAIVYSQQLHARVNGVDESLVLAELIDDALGFERSLCEMARVTVHREYAELPPVRVDRHRLLEIVMNLLVNAREAVSDPMVEGARDITVRTCAAGESRFTIEVRDTGVGIAPENMIKVFNQGFTTKPGGHGFGLHGSSCAAIELGGQLTVASDGVGAGASFTLTLPIDRTRLAGAEMARAAG